MEKKTVLISGGTSGIGLASARLCARAGMNVVINGRNEERRDTIVKNYWKTKTLKKFAVFLR